MTLLVSGMYSVDIRMVNEFGVVAIYAIYDRRPLL
jgi:hypothetical protein